MLRCTAARSRLNFATSSEDPATYAMIQHADTIGTFQFESRAQMSMLPRLIRVRVSDSGAA
jgi:error-prone DNA polymerase